MCVARGVSLISSLKNLKPALYVLKVLLVEIEDKIKWARLTSFSLVNNVKDYYYRTDYGLGSSPLVTVVYNIDVWRWANYSSFTVGEGK